MDAIYPNPALGSGIPSMTPHPGRDAALTQGLLFIIVIGSTLAVFCACTSDGKASQSGTKDAASPEPIEEASVVDNLFDADVADPTAEQSPGSDASASEPSNQRKDSGPTAHVDSGQSRRDAGPDAAAVPSPRPDDTIERINWSDAGDSGGSAAKRVFITSSKHTGDVGGPNGADQICAALAREAGLPGTFKAWLSTRSVSASSRLTHYEGYYARTDGVIVAYGWNDLIDGMLAAPITRDEAAEEVEDGVWTGTLFEGISYEGEDCDGFTAATTGTALCGTAIMQRSAWTEDWSPPCVTALRLYCFEQ